MYKLLPFCRRESKEKEFNRDAALIEMQLKIQQIFTLLGGKPTRPTSLGSSLSRSRLSVFSNLSTQLQVEDDYESDNEVSAFPEQQSSMLSSITEEAEPVRQPVRRKLSNLSNMSGTSTDVESDIGTVSDYLPLSDDRYDSIA